MKLMCDKNPSQMKLPFALWNRKAIKQVIWDLWSIRLALRTISDYMKRWGFTPQKPAKAAYERNPNAVQKWLDEEYPFIKKRAKLFVVRSTGVMRQVFVMIVSIVEDMRLKEKRPWLP